MTAGRWSRAVSSQRLLQPSASLVRSFKERHATSHHDHTESGAKSLHALSSSGRRGERLVFPAPPEPKADHPLNRDRPERAPPRNLVPGADSPVLLLRDRSRAHRRELRATRVDGLLRGPLSETPRDMGRSESTSGDPAEDASVPRLRSRADSPRLALGVGRDGRRS
jgi:hypothetical protein